VTTYQWLLMLHVTAAFLFVGGSVAAGILNTLAIRSDKPSETAYLLKSIRMTLPFIGIGSIFALLLGIWLWHEAGYSISAWWIWAAVVLWVLANALGGRGGRHQEKARELAEKLAGEGDTSTAELKALLRDRQGLALSYLAGLATLGILILMIWKPGA
jgi:uncharacterized membrane protein